jgi:hypothetical protein
MIENDIWPELKAAKCNGGGGCMVVRKVAGLYVVTDTKTGQCLVFSRREYAAHRRQVLEGSWPQVLLRLVKQALLLAQPAVYVARLVGHMLVQIWR